VRWPFITKSKTRLALKEDSLFPVTRFSFKLLRELANTESTANLFFSPFSIMMCLLMLYEGAIGETRDAIAKVLEIADGDESDWRSSLPSLLKLDAPGATLSVANSLWCDDRTHVNAEFVAHVRDAYGAEAFELSLRDPSSVARINAWVANKTAGKIDSILAELQPLAALVAVNAIYFKGKWTSPFESGLTRVEPFYLRRGPALHLRFMRQSGTYDYLENPKFQAVRLPYGGEERVATYIFLPPQNVAFASFQEMLTSAAWDEWMRSFRQMKGVVALPRFRAEYKCELNPAFRALGMAQALDPDRARFDKIASPPPALWIDQVVHRALVEMNEEGTEAAAATAVAMCAASAIGKPEKFFVMIVNRPFFFVIRDDPSDTILFMGCIHSPEPLS